MLRWKDMSPPMRAFVVVAAWFAMAGPLWLLTVKTYRAPLPLGELSFYESHISSEHQARVPVVLEPTHELADIVDAAQHVVNQRLDSYNVRNWTIEFTTEPTPEALVLTFSQASDHGAGFHIDDKGRKGHIEYDLETLQSGLVPAMTVDVLLDAVYRQELAWWAGHAPLSSSAASYSPQLHISLSVLSGDGQAIDFDPALFYRKFSGLRSYLGRHVANITVDSQLEHYARPGCPTTPGTPLSTESLSTFVNFAEWNLASTMPYPTLNFVLYIGDHQIENSATNSFLVPQWGGVAIMREADIEKYYPIFQGHLLALLGAPAEPASLDLRLDALARIHTARGLKATAQALGSLERLAQSMQHIAIPASVLQNCNTALGYLKQALAAPSPSHVHAGLAFKHAQAAFFEKDMVSQTFFPDEHKMAVYLPLLAPVGMLLVQRYRGLGVFRDIQFRRELQKCDDAAALAKKSKVE